MILPTSIVDELSRWRHKGWGKVRCSPDEGPRVKERQGKSKVRMRVGCEHAKNGLGS